MKRRLSIRSGDTDDIERFMQETYAPATVRGLGENRVYGVEGAMVAFDGALVEWSDTVGNFEVSAKEEFESVVFNMMTRKSMRHHLRKGDVELKSGDALTFRGASKAGLVDGSRHVTLAITNDLLQRRLSILLDGTRQHEIGFFEAPIPYEKIKPFADFLCQLETSPILSLAGLLRGKTDAIEAAIVDAFLLTYPSTWSETLARPATSLAPRQVKRAIDFIHAHPTRYHSPEKLASLSNVSVRSLQYTFKSVTLHTISEYQNLLRLKLARQEILDDPSTSLTDVAKNWGFCSLSNFGLSFRKIYGVAPSALRCKR